MDSAPSLLALLGRGPGIAVLPGAARRFSPPLRKKKQHIKKFGVQNNAGVHPWILIFWEGVFHFRFLVKMFVQ